jgi:hypothetical protein
MRPTLEQLMERCREERDENGRVHMVWTGGVSGSGKVPRWNYGVGCRINARRVAYEEHYGVQLQPHERVGTCERYLCLSKDCLHVTSRREAALKGYSRPEARERHRKAVQELGRMSRILSPGQAQLAARSPMSGKRLAEFLGCSEELVSAIRNGRNYADVVKR